MKECDRQYAEIVLGVPKETPIFETSKLDDYQAMDIECSSKLLGKQSSEAK